MIVDFKLPDLGEGIHEAEIVSVKIKSGDTIKEDQIMFEVETDKALVEIPSPYSGIVTKVYVEAGKTITVGSAMVSIETTAPANNAAKSKSAQDDNAIKTKLPEQPNKTNSPASTLSHTAGSSPAPNNVSAKSDAIVPATPATRRLARELGVDLHQVIASGALGRVYSQDVQAFANATKEHPGQTVAPNAPAAGTTPSASPRALSQPGLPDFSSFGKIERVPFRSVRRKTAENMSLSWEQIPHVTHFDEVDVTELEALRAKYEKEAISRGGKLTLTVFMLKAVASSLVKFPQFNSSLDLQNGELIFKHYCHLGIAVAGTRGLIVPVIRNVDHKHIIDLAVELADIVEKTRSGKIELERLQGGSFTITNVGTIGGTGMVPMINFPEAAILGMAKAKLKPIVREGKIEIRLMLPLALAFDHRINDGAEAAHFMNHVVKQLEEPFSFILEA
jgi:pyruvate dehydrogenase E2 component (dihydrolipoamide acetyltransferase)